MNKIKAAKELENNGREFVRMRFKSELQNLFPSHSLPFRERERMRGVGLLEEERFAFDR